MADEQTELAQTLQTQLTEQMSTSQALRGSFNLLRIQFEQHNSELTAKRSELEGMSAKIR